MIIYSIFISVIVCLFIAFLYILWQLKKTKLENSGFSSSIDLYENILRNTQDSWCLWAVSKNVLNMSLAFKKNLKVEHLEKMEDLLKHFNAGPFSPFAKAIEHVYDIGGSFQLQLSHQDQEFLLSGKAIDADAVPPRYILITLKDVTEDILKEQYATKKIRHLKSECETLKCILNEAPLALWHRNLQGRITYCNTVYAGIASSSIARVVAENVQLTQQVNLYELAQNALEQSSKISVRSHVVVEGQRRLLDIAEIPTPFNGSTVGYAMDISVIEELENSIIKTDRSYKDILNALSSPIAVFDENRQLSFYNLAYKQLFDFPQRFLDTRPTLGDILEDLRKRRRMQEYGNFQAHKKERNDLFNNLISPMEEMSYLPDGKTVRIRISPYPLGGILFIFENITNQLDLERDVNTLLAVQKTTLDHLKEGIVVLGNDGKIRLLNPAVYTIWNISEDKKLQEAQKWLESLVKNFPDEHMHQHWIAQLAKCFTQRHALSERLYLNHHKVVDWSYVPLPDGSHMLAFVDASDEWLHEQSLKTKNMNLEMNQRLKNDYLEKINYDIQIPLNDIIGFSNTLNIQMFGPLNEKQQDYCVQIQRHAEEVKNLFETALESMHFDQGNLVLQRNNVDLEKFIQSYEEQSTKKANDHGANLVFQKEITHVMAFMDEKRIQQALLGLLSYYLKNVFQGEDVFIKVETIDSVLQISFGKENFAISHNFGKNVAKMILEAHGGALEETMEDGYYVCVATLNIA